jgi:RimJ/RimL family protein N-acetyltransferase
MPFLKPWALEPEDAIRRNVIQSHWSRLGKWQPTDWALNLAVFHEGAPIGLQEMWATDFGVSGLVETGSWLGLPHHHRGFGTEMRAAVLHLAFAGLGAAQAASTAFADNHASLAVSARLGYRPNGTHRRSASGVLRVDQRSLLTREDWERNRVVEVAVSDLEPCLPMFGVPEL